MELLKALHIENPREVLCEYAKNNHLIFRMVRMRSNQMKQNNQKGGGGKHSFINFEGTEFKIYYYKDEDRLDFAVYEPNNDNLTKYCIHMMIEKDIDMNINIAHVNNISYFPNCTKSGLIRPGGGGILLRLAIHIAKNKKFGVSKIILTDNSAYYCKKNRMEFPLMYTLMNGYTWYGKYGFRPCNTHTHLIDKDRDELYMKNIEIIKNTKVKDTKILHYMGLLEENEKIETKYDQMNIGKFIKSYLKKIDQNCETFFTFYKKIAIDMGIYNFVNHPFVLNLN